MEGSRVIRSAIKEKLKYHFPHAQNLQFNSVGGGCINECYRLTFSNQQFFCKINSATKFPQLFLKEKHGLELMRKRSAIKTPNVIDCFLVGDKQVLILERIQEGEKTKAFWEKFGEQLAALHHVSEEQFGLEEDNYMGSVLQHNKQTNNWNDFFIHQRLQPLVTKCLDKHLLTVKHEKQFERLYQIIPTVFSENARPSLLHGDLWSGNFMCGENAEPVLIDPAVYYGHASMDLAMTTLFGGFSFPFYEAYNYHFPQPANHEEQWKMCNLYPLLIHLFLFGSSYLSQVENILLRYS